MIRRYLIDAPNDTRVQVVRYTIVGGLAFVVDFGTLFGLTEWLSFHYLASAAIAFVLGLLVNYELSVRWVFARRTVDRKLVEFTIFAGIGVVGLALTEVLLWVFTERVGLHYLASKLLTAFFVYLWNFLVRKFILFR